MMQNAIDRGAVEVAIAPVGPGSCRLRSRCRIEVAIATAPPGLSRLRLFGVEALVLGYLLMFWDRNRQALHDKPARSIVTRV